MTPEEGVYREQTLAFLELMQQQGKNAFSRECHAGHITASSWIVDKTYTQVLLLHHRKLGKWVQPGGHCDGSDDVVTQALREAEEETGLQSVQLVSADLFDIDIHDIPEFWKEPAHQHYDMRFLCEADAAETIKREEEAAYDLRWVPLHEVQQLRSDESVMRMVDKTLWLKDNFSKRVA